MAYHRVCNESNKAGATNGAGYVLPSGAPEFNPSFSGVRVSQSLGLYSVFVLFPLDIVLSVLLRLTASNYPVDIFRLIL
jgi:hypothetical protein